MSPRKLSVMVGAVMLLAGAADARTWHIRPEGSGDAPTIQAGIDSCASGDSVLVAPGLYDENLYLAKTITLVSTDGREETVIDAGSRDRVLTINPGDGAGPLIVGFTLRNGRAVDNGGGAWIGFTGTVLRDNIIENNVAGVPDVGQGGGVFVYHTATSCTIEYNEIRNNFAGSEGGGIAALFSNVHHNRIINNSSHVAGGGAMVVGSASRFTFNVIIGNYSDYFAGGVVVDGGVLENNTIVANRIANTDRVPAGVAVRPASVVRNNIVVHNTGGSGGFSEVAGIQCANEQLNIISCNDVWGNDGSQLRCDVVWPDNFSSNPLFCDELRGDFRIAETSPCASAMSGCGLVGALEPFCQVTTVRSITWSSVKRLYR